MRVNSILAGPMPRYEVDDGGGRWILKDGPRRVLTTHGDTLAICFDCDTGEVIAHGSPSSVRETSRLEVVRRRLDGRLGDPGSVQTLEARSYPLLGRPTPGEIHLTVHEVNLCLHTPKHILTKVRQLEEDGFTVVQRDYAYG